MQAAEIYKQIAIFAWLDRGADALQIGQDRFEHGCRAHRIRLQDDSLGTQRHDFAEWQTSSHAGSLGFRRAQLDDFALARCAAQHQRPAIPGRMAQYFDAKLQLCDPDASDPHVGPRLTAHSTHYRTSVRNQVRRYDEPRCLKILPTREVVFAS